MSGHPTSKRRLICEGWLEEHADPAGEGLVMYPEVAYVVQPPASNTNLGRIWYAKGRPDGALAESLSEKHHAALVESYEQLDLEERKLADGTTAKLPKGGRWVVEGPFQRSDVKNANKRIYPRAIWERLIGDPNSYAQQTIKARGMLGHLEHPADGRTDGSKGAMLVTGATLRKDGVVWGECELLDTPHGLILQEYTRKGVRWGVSSRGNGEVKEDGVVEVNSFALETWDAVMKPSVPGAYPTLSQAKKLETATTTSGKDAVSKTAVTSAAKEAVEFTAHAKALSETALDSLDADARAKYTRDLIDAMDRGSSLVSSGLLPHEQATELQGWLTHKLHALAESGGLSLDAAIDEALRAATADDKPVGEGFDRVLESLKQRLDDSVSEASALREQLEAAESRSSVLQVQCDELTEQLSEAEGKLADVSAKLKLAEDLLSTRPNAPANGRVKAAVEAAVRQVPDLARYVDLLEKAETADEVRELSERLLPVAIVRAPEPPARPRIVASTTPRPTLPVGEVRSDDLDMLKPAKPLSETFSEGARMAAAIVSLQEAR